MVDEVIEAVHELYKIILKIANTPLDQLILPPPEGHRLPGGYEEKAALRKTSAVVDLMKRLPYCTLDRHLAPNSRAIVYSDSDSPWYHPHLAWRPVAWPEEPPMVLPCELPLTQGDDEAGSFLVINIETWEGRFCCGTVSIVVS